MMIDHDHSFWSLLGLDYTRDSFVTHEVSFALAVEN